MPERPRILVPVPTSIDLEYARQCWPQYAAAIREAGGEAVVAELRQSSAELTAVARTCCGVVLPGNLADISPERYGHERDAACGVADQAREHCDWTLLDYVFATGTPLLAICYGMQSLNVFCGGTLLQDIDVIGVRHTAGPGVGIAHTAIVTLSSQLGRVLDATEVEAGERGFARLPINSSHHQAIGIVGEGLRVVARSAGDGVVEAIELAEDGENFLLGVQWHPERTVGLSATSRAVFRELLRAASGVSRRGQAEALVR